MLIRVYFLDNASDVTRKKEHTPLIPSQEGNKKSGFKERISPASLRGGMSKVSKYFNKKRKFYEKTIF